MFRVIICQIFESLISARVFDTTKVAILKAIGSRSSLRGGKGELGNSKLKHMAPTNLHNIKLKHAI